MKIKCNKCKKYIIYIPDDWELNIPITCIKCHENKKQPRKTKTWAETCKRMRKGKRADIHYKYSFRSGTEMDFARILNLLNLEWKYEERAFSFSEYKRAPHVYIMDFEITSGNNILSSGFYEVKGRVKPSDREKLRRLKRDYPEEAKQVTIIIQNKYDKKFINFLNKYEYKFMFMAELEKQYREKIPEWGR